VKSGIVWAPSARADLAHIDLYYSELDLDFANRTAPNAVAAAKFLQANPHAGSKVDGTAYRKWHVPESPFLLIYRSEKGAIRILRVRHARENWQSLL
jgi:plasmid stabilization system protein ParE